MNFETIFHGMLGREFIRVFNDNFNKADRTLLEILATLIYKVKSTDIKEFKVIDNVVSYTLEEAPVEGEDNRQWTPVDITQWGNINGSIEDQEDLWNILQDKAAVETVATIENLLSTLTQEFNTTKSQVETNTSDIRSNNSAIADILVALVEKVNSTNIKAIRLNNSVFQWSPDGRTWYEQATISSISWGHVTGDITTQEDLMEYFSSINSSIEDINTNIGNINSDMELLGSNFTALETSFDNLEATIEAQVDEVDTKADNIRTLLDNHIAEFNTYKTSTDAEIGIISETAEESSTLATSVSEDLESHLIDYNNPHQITKNTISLGNVDNTSDADKPLSTAQKIYVDNSISSVRTDMSNLPMSDNQKDFVEDYVETQVEEVRQIAADRSGLVLSRGYIDKLFVGPESEYENIDSKVGLLAFIIDNELITTKCTIFSETISTFNLYKDGVLVTPTTELATVKIYTEIPNDNANYVVKVIIDEVETSYNINLSFSSANEINIDELIEENSNENEPEENSNENEPEENSNENEPEENTNENEPEENTNENELEEGGNE